MTDAGPGPPIGIAEGRALGVGTRIVVTRPDRIADAEKAVGRVLEEVDRALSRFREDSELSLVNAAPGVVHHLGPMLVAGLVAGLRGARLSGGAVDLTVGRAMKVVGYDTTFNAVAPDGPALALRAESVPGWESIRFDPDAGTVWVPRGVEIDLGATGKGLAADLAAAAALAALDGKGGVLVSLGGDIAVAGTPPDRGWVIQVGEDSAAGISALEEAISITSGAIATSSTTVRRWTRAGVALHHILDPRTGLPTAGPWRTASVVARDCLDANIAATAAIVMGSPAVGWLEAARLPARLVDRDGRVTRIGAWPEPGGSL